MVSEDDFKNPILRHWQGQDRHSDEKRRLFNPEPAPDGSTICAVQYPVKGGTSIVLIDPADGKILRKRSMPDSLQAVEVCFHGNSIVFNTISEAGSGIFLSMLTFPGTWNVSVHRFL